MTVQVNQGRVVGVFRTIPASSEIQINQGRLMIVARLYKIEKQAEIDPPTRPHYRGFKAVPGILPKGSN